MCLGIPGQVIEIVDRDAGLAKVDISGVRRDVSVALVDEPAAPIEVGEWVLIHVGFALARIDEDDARETLALLERGAELQRELDELRGRRGRGVEAGFSLPAVQALAPHRAGDAEASVEAPEPGRCITCSDEAVEAEVVAVDGLTAFVR